MAQRPTPTTMRSTRSKRSSLTRLWSIRLAVAVAAGLLFGAAGGVVGVNTLEPGRPAQPDSLQLMLDSIASGVPAARTATPGAPAVPAAQTVPAALDSVSSPLVTPVGPANPPSDAASSASSDITVPNLAGVEEGAARVALTGAGFVIGSTEFRASRSPTGTVLTTLPTAGAFVKRGTPISLVLSDGRAPVDSVLAPHGEPAS